MSIYNYQDCPDKLLSENVSDVLGLIVCIPCYNEPSLKEALYSLIHCDQPICDIEILVLINESDAVDPVISKQNEQSYMQVLGLETPHWIKLLPIYIKAIPTKYAGVGTARKMALDEAARRLELSRSSLNVLSCYDADSTCSRNYLIGIVTYFMQSSKEAVSIHYEHTTADLQGDDEQRAIYLYELHLRYFVQMQALANLPFAYHTVGSSMACTVRGYRRIGGMNKRKAGEDFYFLQKFIKNDSCDRLHTITVFPSSRSSDRVPFGTGRAVLKMKADGVHLSSYHYQSFIDVQSFVALSESLYECTDLTVAFERLPKPIRGFLVDSKLDIKISKLIQNTTNQNTFRKALYQLFDAFQLMKYLHYARDNYYADDNVLTLASHALKTFNEADVEEHELLDLYRSWNLTL